MKKHTMSKSIIISILLGFFIATPAFASLTQSAVMDSVDYKIQQALMPVQAQINSLRNQPVQTQAPQIIQTTTIDPNIQIQITALTNRVNALEKQNIQLQAQITNHEKRMGVIETLIKKVKKILKI
jgi:peptidoglycan hydrolase CwlO-like protein